MIKAGDLLDDDEVLDGENTFQGDVENETNAQGGIDPDHVGRINK